jgi:hypothetical protein
MRTPFDEKWFDGLLSARAPTRTSPASARVERAEDWGDAPDVFGFAESSGVCWQHFASGWWTSTVD